MPAFGWGDGYLRRPAQGLGRRRIVAGIDCRFARRQKNDRLHRDQGSCPNRCRVDPPACPLVPHEAVAKCSLWTPSQQRQTAGALGRSTAQGQKASGLRRAFWHHQTSRRIAGPASPGQKTVEGASRHRYSCSDSGDREDRRSDHTMSAPNLCIYCVRPQGHQMP
jgi:hypothetical protein